MRSQKNNIQYILLNVMFLLFLLALGFRFFRQLFSTYTFGSWEISEFLINYQGGFVRRGLLGEVLFIFFTHLNLDVEWTIKIISLIIFLAVCVFFIRAFLKKEYNLYILPLCFFLGMGILTDNWVRKDYLMLYGLILILKTYQGRLSTIFKIVVLNIVFMFIILTHEVFAFFSIPAILFLLFHQYKSKTINVRLILAALSLLPSMMCFLVTLYYHGNLETARAIWDSWKVFSSNMKPFNKNEWNAIASIGWPSKETLLYHLKMNFLGINKDLYSAFIWGITFPIVYYICTNVLLVFRKNINTFTNSHKMVLSSILLFQLLSLLPVFIMLSCDYIRLFFYWISSSFAIFLIIPKEKVETLIPPFYSKFISYLNNGLSNILYPNKATLVFLILFIGISYYGFNFESMVKNSMIYNIFYILSKPFAVAEKVLALIH